jgi:hypothetical protein
MRIDIDYRHSLTFARQLIDQLAVLIGKALAALLDR